MKSIPIVLILFLLALRVPAQDHRKPDSIKRFLTTEHDASKYEVLFDLFSRYVRFNTDSAIYYAHLSLKKALDLGDSVRIAKSLHALGDSKVEGGRIREGIDDMERALEIATVKGISNRRKVVLNSLALAYIQIGDYDVALDYNFQSLQIRKAEGDQEAISISLNNIGLVYLEIRDYENALPYFIRSYDLKKAIGNSDDIEARLINIGYCHSGLQQHEKSVDVFMEAFTACRGSCATDILMKIRSGLGNGYRKLGRLAEATDEHRSAIALARKIRIPRNECIGLRSLSEIALEQGTPDIAMQYMDSAQCIAEQTDLKVELLENSLVYSKIFSSLSDYENSAKYQRQYIELNQDIFSGELIQKISRVTVNHAEQENLKTIAARDQLVALQKEIIDLQRIEYAFVFTITILVIGFMLFLFRSYQVQKKTNRALAVAKGTIEKQNRLLQNTNQELETQVAERTRELHQSNESLRRAKEEMDHFIYRTSHDIQGPLASLQGICNVALMDVKNLVARDYLLKLDKCSGNLSTTLKRLLVINQINNSELHFEMINLKRKIAELIENERKKGLSARIGINIEVDSKLRLWSNETILNIILQNLIENAIKFYDKSEQVVSFVTVEALAEKEFIIVKVRDNGIGISEESRETIFKLFVRASDRFESGGIGLYLVKLATTKLAGFITCAITPEGFTEFVLRLPAHFIPADGSKAT